MIDPSEFPPDTMPSDTNRYRFAVMVGVATILIAINLTGCRKPTDNSAQAKTALKNRQNGTTPPTERDQPKGNSSSNGVRAHGTGTELPEVNDSSTESQGNTNRNPKNGASVPEPDKPPQQIVELHPEAGRFNEGNLHKDHTLFVVAFDSVPRQTYFLSNYSYIMTPEQIERTCELIDSFESRFTELREARAKILANATDDQDVATMLLNNRIDIVMVSREIRRHIYRDILTTEQQDSHTKEVDERRARRAKNAAITSSSGDSTTPAGNGSNNSSVPDSIPKNPR